MDLEFGARMMNEIMNNPAYDPQPGEFDDPFRPGEDQDPSAFFERLGIGQGSGGPPMPSSFPKPEEVRSKARAFSEKILGDWGLLNNIVERNEATIRKRWMKKTKEQRKKILLAAWPNMVSVHRPDFDAFKNNKTKDPSKRNVFMWPYINLEDLLKSRLFLIFLNSRARNKPSAFAQADQNAVNFGITTTALNPAFLNNHVMMFSGRHTPETYGELIAWDDHPDAFEWLTTQRGAHPGQGLLVLEIQERVYKFLVDCCRSILHEMTSEDLADSAIPVQEEPASLSGNETGLASLAATAAEAPYRLPANLDLKRLESLMAAKLSAAEDHVWALREDPGYFAETVLNWKEHRQECIPDTLGRKHPVLANPNQERIFWQRILNGVISTALSKFESLGSLHEQIIRLQRLQEQYTQSISPEKDLPEEYAMAFYKLDHHLRQFIKGPIGILKTGFVASPPIRPYFVREPQDPTSTMMTVKKRTGLPKDKARDELIWIITTLFNEQQLHLAGLNTLMDELERQLEEDAHMKELVSFWVADQISDLSVLSQCVHQIELYQPWAATFEDAMVQHEDELNKDMTETGKRLYSCFFEPSPAIVSLGIPTGGNFRYPVDKRRTRENTEAMIQAEQNLDAFWRAYDRELKQTKGIPAGLKKLMSQRMLQRTPDWVEPVKATKTTSATTDVDALTKPLSELYYELERNTERTVNYDKLPGTKDKLKTRGLSQLVKATPEPGPGPSAPDVQPTFKVDKRALKAFNTLFFTPSASSQPGEVPWGDFLHAMSSTGFTAEKLYGSVWQFTPTKLDVERSIQFHEPHPSGRIPFTIARRHGRRLNRAYGWHGGMFELA